jgi:hypothetical protein
MFRFKMLLGLAGIIAALAVSAAPAFAEFEAKGQWKQAVKVTVSGQFIDAGNAKVKCPANEIEATASVQSKGVINEHEKGGKQVQTKKGPHLNINVLKWGANCEATIGATVIKPVTVSPCELQAQQKIGQTTALGGVVKPCVIKAGPCELTALEGKETTPEKNEGKNVGLSEIKLENKGSNLFTIINTKGVEVEVKKTTELCTLTKGTNTTGELLGVEGIAEGVTEV